MKTLARLSTDCLLAQLPFVATDHKKLNINRRISNAFKFLFMIEKDKNEIKARDALFDPML